MVGHIYHFHMITRQDSQEYLSSSFFSLFPIFGRKFARMRAARKTREQEFMKVLIKLDRADKFPLKKNRSGKSCSVIFGTRSVAREVTYTSASELFENEEQPTMKSVSVSFMETDPI